jgi:hypothetical protein
MRRALFIGQAVGLAWLGSVVLAHAGDLCTDIDAANAKLWVEWYLLGRPNGEPEPKQVPLPSSCHKVVRTPQQEEDCRAVMKANDALGTAWVKRADPNEPEPQYVPLPAYCAGSVHVDSGAPASPGAP